MSELTVGIDIGTSSVKAVAADADGNVVARARIPHEFRVPSPLRFEHDAKTAWYDGPRRALDALRGIEPRGISVAAMVPSLTAVDDEGVPCAPGLLYGDERGHTGSTGNPAESGELAQFLRWHTGERPDAHGYWTAQAVANHALTGRAVVSTTVAATAYPLFDWSGWDADLATDAGARVEQLGEIAVSGQAAATVPGYDNCVLEPGTIDAMGEQIVAGADAVGDVLVILGTTLIVWPVIPERIDGGAYLLHPAHRARRHLDDGRTEQRRRLVPRLGDPAPRRRRGRARRAAGRSAPRASLGAVPARRAGAAQRSRPPSPTRRPRSDTRARRGSARGVRSLGLRRVGARSTRHPWPRAASSPPAVEPESPVGWKPSRTPPDCPCTYARCPKAARSARRSWRAWPRASKRR